MSVKGVPQIARRRPRPKPKPAADSFAAALVRLRHAAGLSQAALADRAGVSASAVKQWEAGRREPVFSALVKVARAVGASLGDFLPD